MYLPDTPNVLALWSSSGCLVAPSLQIPWAVGSPRDRVAQEPLALRVAGVTKLCEDLSRWTLNPKAAARGTLLLIHGGLWEDGMDADRFWRRPGIVSGLTRYGFDVLAPERLRRAPDWSAEADHLAAHLPPRPVTIVAGSNGCSVAVRLALMFPSRVERLVLAWPATAGDADVDARTRTGLAQLGAAPHVIEALLAGHTLRGVTDDELASLDLPVAVLPSLVANPFHQRHTVDQLCRILRQAVELPGCPEPPDPRFAEHATSFLKAIADFATP